MRGRWFGILVPVAILVATRDSSYASAYSYAATTDVRKQREGPTLCPSDQVTQGYSSIGTLRSDLMVLQLTADNTTSTSNHTFVLCPGTKFTFAKERMPLVIRTSHVRLQCGNATSLHQQQDCVFQNGHILVWIEEHVQQVQLVGLTFSNSSYASVVVATRGTASVVLEDCHWNHMQGTAGLVVNPQEQQQDDLSAEKLAPASSPSVPVSSLTPTTAKTTDETIVSMPLQPTSAPSAQPSTSRATIRRERKRRLFSSSMMTSVMIRNCRFQHSQVTIAMVAQYNGHVDIVQSAFQSNNTTETIIKTNGGTLSLSDTTFRNNTLGVIPAPIFLASHASLELRGGNCHTDETSVSTCSGVYVQEPGSDCSNPFEECPGSCQSLEQCKTSSFPSMVPSGSSPSAWPTLFQVPSLQPSTTRLPTVTVLPTSKSMDPSMPSSTTLVPSITPTTGMRPTMLSAFTSTQPSTTSILPSWSFQPSGTPSVPTSVILIPTRQPVKTSPVDNIPSPSGPTRAPTRMPHAWPSSSPSAAPSYDTLSLLPTALLIPRTSILPSLATSIGDLPIPPSSNANQPISPVARPSDFVNEAQRNSGFVVQEASFSRSNVFLRTFLIFLFLSIGTAVYAWRARHETRLEPRETEHQTLARPKGWRKTISGLSLLPKVKRRNSYESKSIIYIDVGAASGDGSDHDDDG